MSGFGKDGKGTIIRSIESISLSTLANNTAIKLSSSISGSTTEDFRLLKLVAQAIARDLTSSEGQGLCIGLADNELSVTEIAECLTADGPLGRNDNVPNERAMRPVWLIGQIDKRFNDLDARFVGEDNSPFMQWKKRWSFSDPAAWTLFVFNYGVALTTGATVNLIQTAFGVWIT